MGRRIVVQNTQGARRQAAQIGNLTASSHLRQEDTIRAFAAGRMLGAHPPEFVMIVLFTALAACETEPGVEPAITTVNFTAVDP